MIIYVYVGLYKVCTCVVPNFFLTCGGVITGLKCVSFVGTESTAGIIRSDSVYINIEFI